MDKSSAKKVPKGERKTKQSIKNQQSKKCEQSDVKDEPAMSNENEPALCNKDKIRPKRSKNRQSSAKRSKMYETSDFVREVSPVCLKLIDAQDVKDTENCDNVTSHEQQRPKVPDIAARHTVQCNICKKVMVESRLANHIRLLHVEDLQGDGKEAQQAGKKSKFKCDKCGKMYGTRYIYRQHLRNHEEGRPKCPECGSTFASAFTLFRHRAKAHNIEHHYKNHICNQCDKIFFSSSELRLHQQRHSNQREFKCAECDKEFAVKGNLMIHMRTHAKTKLYRCDICSNSFSHPYSLTSHRRIHTNEYPFKCNVCDKACRSRHQLASHQNVHSDLRPFQCTQCSKSFKSRTAFKTHQDEHQGIKRFICQFCDRQFQCYGNKLKHERRHIGDKRHKCEQCPKAFIEKQELRNHLKVHDKNIMERKEEDNSASTSKRET